MKAKPNYYTPTIKEFHVGFEYESNLEDNKWEKDVFEPNRVDDSILISSFFSKIKNLDCYRVKHLDREDIESLGWVFKDQGNVNNFIFERKNDSFLRASVSYGEPSKIDFYRYGGWETPRFNIKNKSELSRLMKQLGINE